MFEWSDLFTVGILIVLEGLLSADNAMVMAVMVLGLPEKQRHKALQYGLVVGQLLVLIHRYPAIVDGAFIIIAWVGIKLVLEYLHAEHLVPFEVPQWASLSLIVIIFVASLWYARREARLHHVRHLEGIT